MPEVNGEGVWEGWAGVGRWGKSCWAKFDNMHGGEGGGVLGQNSMLMEVGEGGGVTVTVTATPRLRLVAVTRLLRLAAVIAGTNMILYHALAESCGVTV